MEVIEATPCLAITLGYLPCGQCSLSFWSLAETCYKAGKTLYNVTGLLNQCYSWGGAMGHRSIQQKNGPLTTEIAILNLERMALWNFKFSGNKWKMAHTMVCPAITLLNPTIYQSKCPIKAAVVFERQRWLLYLQVHGNNYIVKSYM